MTKSHRGASCVAPCVWTANARDPHTKDTVEEATVDSGRGSLGDGPSSRVAVTRDHASLSLPRKTADTTEHTLLHPQAPRTQQVFTHSLVHSPELATRSAQHKDARDSRPDNRAWAQVWSCSQVGFYPSFLRFVRTSSWTLCRLPPLRAPTRLPYLRTFLWSFPRSGEDSQTFFSW